MKILKAITYISVPAALWILSNMEQGTLGTWGDVCLVVIALWWTSLAVLMKIGERR